MQFEINYKTSLITHTSEIKYKISLITHFNDAGLPNGYCDFPEPFIMVYHNQCEHYFNDNSIFINYCYMTEKEWQAQDPQSRYRNIHCFQNEFDEFKAFYFMIKPLGHFRDLVKVYTEQNFSNVRELAEEFFSVVKIKA